ncbi:hypothetical protein F915_03755 [Acinetobacter baumannii NIPH 70]|nr:hypothetical protein F915_03755 [Acinetobacter baumannii NIPH 70]
MSVKNSLVTLKTYILAVADPQRLRRYMDREHFMDFFRNDEKLEQLTPDDRIEIFLNVLLGSSDIDVKLLNELLNNYDISNIVISEK